MFEPVIDNNDAPQPVVPSGQGDKDTVTMTRAEADSLRRERDEARESERYWAGLARGAKPAEPAGETEQEDLDTADFVSDDARGDLEGDTAEKLVEEFSTEGVGALKKRGFITAQDAQRLAVDVAAKVSRELIGRERQKLATDTQIMSEFGDLKDPNSDLFKETAKRYQKAVAMDPNAKKTPAALYLAADAARSYLDSKRPRSRRDDDESDNRPEPEDDRRRRADSQDARTRSRPEADTDDMLGDEARSIIKQMGITEEEFKASQKTYGSGQRSRRR
jgi:hypothetical protein